MQLSEINPHIRCLIRIPRPRVLTESTVARDCRLFYILSGAGELTVDGTPYSLDAGMVFYIPSGCPYLFRFANEPLEIVVVNFDFDRTRAELGQMPPLPARCCRAELLVPAPADTPFAAPIVLSSASGIRRDLLDAIRVFAAGGAYGAERASSLLRGVLFSILGERENRGEHSLVRRVREYVSRHYAEELSEDRLGRELGYHPYHINRVWKRETGVPFHRYLVEYRMAVAENLLLNTDLAITDIATAVGIGSHPYFSFCFRRHTGMAPSQYRRASSAVI